MFDPFVFLRFCLESSYLVISEFVSKIIKLQNLFRDYWSNLL